MWQIGMQSAVLQSVNTVFVLKNNNMRNSNFLQFHDVFSYTKYIKKQILIYFFCLNNCIYFFCKKIQKNY